MRPFLPNSRPIGTGAAVPVRLAHARAGGGHVRPRLARSPARRVGARLPRGPRRRRGEGLYTAVTSAVSQTGVHIVAVFLFLAALLLLTGATIAGVLNATRTSIRGTTRALRETGAGLGALAPRPGEVSPPAPQEPVRPPEAEDPQKLVVRATHVEAPPIDGPARFPDLFGNAPPPATAAAGGDEAPEAPPEPEPEPAEAREDAEAPGVTRAKPAPEVAREGPDAAGPLPRHGHGRSRLRMEAARRARAQALQRRGRRARHHRAGAGRDPARGDARALRDRGEGHRHDHRPAHHALRAAPRARDQGLQGGAAQGRHRLRPGRLGDPHPRPDPRQAGRRRGGAQPPPAHRAPGRRLAGPAQGLVAAHRVAGQGRRRARHRRGPDQDAPPPRGGHDRLR